MLTVDALSSAYGRIEVLHAISLVVAPGEIVALVGSNRAGKTTLLRSLSGVRPPTGGRIVFQGEDIQRLPPHQRVARGIAQSPEGRQVFGPLSVDDNLRLGAFRRCDGAVRERLEAIYAIFPALAERRRRAGDRRSRLCNRGRPDGPRRRRMGAASGSEGEGRLSGGARRLTERSRGYASAHHVPATSPAWVLHQLGNKPFNRSLLTPNA